MKKVRDAIEELEKEETRILFDLVLFQDGKKIAKGFEGEGGYHGKMIESPHYIGIRLREATAEAIVVASYYTERLITVLTSLNLGTCWVTIKDVDRGLRSAYLGEDNKNIAYLLAFGHSKASNPFDTVKDEKSQRIGIEDMVFDQNLDKPVDMAYLEERGLDDLFYYLRFAPSTKNSQPWRFVLSGHRLVLYMEEQDQKVNLMDAGIIMYYFKQLASYIGISEDWKLDKNLNDDKMLGKYKRIGEINL